MGEVETTGAESLWEKLDLVRLVPPLAFFLVGAVLLLAAGVASGEDLLRVLTGPNQTGLALATVAILIISGLAVRALSGGVLRALEGYDWNVPGFGLLGRVLTHRNQNQLQRARKRLSELLAQYPDPAAAPPEAAAEMAKLQGRVAAMPRDHRVLPTRLGNIFRGAEDHPFDRYGIAGVRAWPLLWLCLPPHARTAINAARQDLDRGTEWVTWAALVALWAFALPGYWAALPVGLAVLGAFLCYRRLLGSASVFALLFRSMYDLYRFDLYARLRLAPPASPYLEWEAAQRGGSPINEVLFSQVPDPKQAFRPPPEGEAG